MNVRWLREFLLIRDLSHPNLVTLIGYYSSSNDALEWLSELTTTSLDTFRRHLANDDATRQFLVRRAEEPEVVRANLPHLVYPYTMYGDMNRFLHQSKVLRDGGRLIYSRAGSSTRQSM